MLTTLPLYVELLLIIFLALLLCLVVGGALAMWGKDDE